MKTKTKIIAIILIMIGFGLSNNTMARRIKGSGKIIKETRELSNFTAIDIGSAFEIELIKSNETKIIIETDDNVMPYIKTNVHAKELKVNLSAEINNPTKLSLIIYYKEVNDLDISGAAELYSSDVLTTTYLNLDFSGASDVSLKLDVQSIDAEISGASNVDLEGKSRDAEIDVSGAAILRAYGLELHYLDLEASGASSAKVLVLDKFIIDASGAATVRYKGNPTLDLDDISGAASFKKM
jgi:hypothetical protein